MKAYHDSPRDAAYRVQLASGVAGVRRKDMMVTVYHFDNPGASTELRNHRYELHNGAKSGRE